VASLSQGRTAAAQCGLFTHKSVPVIFEPPCTNVTFSTRTSKVILVYILLYQRSLGLLTLPSLTTELQSVK